MNREKQISRRNDNFKDIKLSLYDIDSSIKYYFDNVMKIMVNYNGEEIPVPFKYASPERWTSIQKNNYIIDRNGQIQSPIIVYKRTSMAKDDDIKVNKIDAENPQLFHIVGEKYSSKNRYQNWNKLQGQHQIKKYHQVVVPDFVVLTYEINIWTDFIEHMNKIIETINYYESSYWGDKRFKFRTKIDDYSTETEIATDSDRIVKGNCTLTLKGYIIPDIYAKRLPNQVILDTKKTIIGTTKNIKGINME